MRADHPLRAVSFALVLGLITGVAYAQTRATAGDLVGTVLDQSQAVVPNATVKATNLATGIERTAVSRSNGRYEMLALPPGEYAVTAAHAGFKTAELTFPLAVGETRQIDFTLTIGETSETVTVVGTAPLFDSRRMAVSTLISQQQIDALPTNGRDFIAFAVLAPGANTDRTPYQGAVATSGLTFAGQSARFNNITVDGLDNNDVMVGGVRATFSQEAVREFQVVVNSYSAEFGKATGGIVNIVTKSGGNRWAGNAFLYVRDRTLNARNHFEMFDAAGRRIDEGKAPYRRYQVGGTLGGPILRDRSFFFLSAEGLRSQANNFVNIDTTQHITAFGTDYGTVVDILERAGFPVEIGHLPYRVDSSQVLGKVDTLLTGRHQLTLRVNWDDLLHENVEHWGGQIARSRGAALESRDVMGAALLTSLFSPQTVNELRLQIAYHDQDMRSLDPTCDGACDREDEGGPTLEIGAIAVGRQRFTPQPRTDVRYQVVDTLTREAGGHRLKAGLDYSYIDQRARLPLHFGGRYVFEDLSASRAASVGLPGPVTALQALALGAPNSYLQGYGNAGVSGPYGEISLFAEDEWRATERLTLKLGVRYQNQFWPALVQNVPGLPGDGWPSDDNNVAPRVGVSWRPGTQGSTSVHGSYGVFYDNLISSLWGLAAGINGAPDHVQTLSLRRTDAYKAWRTADRQWPQPAGSFSVFGYAIQPELKTPYAHHVSVGLDSGLGRVMVSASVVFVRGFNRVGSIDYPTPTGNWRQYTSWGESWYRGLLVSLRRHFSGRGEVLASYTWSKAEDLMADFSFQQPMDRGDGRNPDDPAGLPLDFDPQSERGPSLQDQRHRLVLSGVYMMSRGITVSGIVTAGSGRPYNILAGSDLNGNGDGGSGPSDRPWRIPGDTSTFIGRNAGRLPATMTVDLRVAKQIDVDGRARVDLKVDLFNLLNRTNYTQINHVFGSGAYPTDPLPTFGQFTEAGPPFQAQLAVTVSFGGSR